MEGKLLGGLLMAFTFLVIGIALAVSLANNQVGVTQTVRVNNETIALVINSSTALRNSVVTNVVSITNATNVSQSLTTANYTLVQPQSIFAINRAGNWNVTYDYAQVPDAPSQSFLTITTLLFVVSVLVGLLYYLNPNFRELIDTTLRR